MRVLLIAEACNPAWTSVPLVGYNMARALTQCADLHVTLVTHVRNRAALAATNIHEHAAVAFIDNEFIAAPIYRLAKLLRGGDQLGWTIDTALAWPSYVVFEHLVWRRFRNELQRGQFDLIHRLTPLSPTAVSPLAAKTDVPMLAGPLNGGLRWPREFPELIRREREWLVPLRNCYKLLPYYRQSYRHFAGVIAASHATAADLPRHYRGLRFMMPENGIDETRFPIAESWAAPTSRFRFITAGRIVPYKGLGLTLEAMRRSTRLQQCAFEIVGDGPDRARHEAFVQQHGLGHCVYFRGQLPQTELAASMRNAQAFVFPSLREFGGGVVLEAMACGLPSIIVDYGGPAELVDTTSGIKIPLQAREPLIEQLQHAMETLVADHDRCQRLSAAATNTVRRLHTWTAKAATIRTMYDALISPAIAPPVHE